MIRLASATISSLRLFSRLEGLSSNARFEPGGKTDALQPFPTGLTSIRNPLYSMVVIILCDVASSWSSRVSLAKTVGRITVCEQIFGSEAD
jgi:hypothetical protein